MAVVSFPPIPKANAVRIQMSVSIKRECRCVSGRQRIRQSQHFMFFLPAGFIWLEWPCGCNQHVMYVLDVLRLARWWWLFFVFLCVCIQIRTRGPLRAAVSPRCTEISTYFPLETIEVGEKEAADAKHEWWAGRMKLHRAKPGMSQFLCQRPELLKFIRPPSRPAPGWSMRWSLLPRALLPVYCRLWQELR